MDPDSGVDLLSELIQLNVGGVCYTTTTETLTREPESFFQQLLSAQEIEQHRQVQYSY